MSQSRGYLDDNPELESALDTAKEWYHVPALVLVFGFMLWNRVQNYDNYIVDGEVIFSGTDPWYHYRNTMYVVRNWPATMPFDPWTHFAVGNRSGQFGTLMDQVVGTVAIVLGLGSPSPELVARVALVAPPVMGALAAIPTYFIGRRLGGRIGGVTGIVVLALSAGTFLQRSLVGVYDHQVAEGLLQVTTVLGVMVAVSVAERDKPVYEQFVDRDIPALRSTVGYSVMAGVAMSLYLWTWPPAVLLLGILGIFLLLWLTMEFRRGNSPEHVAIAGAVMMTAVAVLQLAVLKSMAVTATDHSLLQPLLAGAIAVGCVFMAWLARYMEAEGYDRNLYPVTVGGILVSIAVFMAILTPDLLSYFVDQVLRVVGFTASPSLTQTSVGEATPLRDPGLLYRYHGLAVFVAILGAALILLKQFSKDTRAELFLMVVWGAFILSATFTQQRFGVYLVFPVAALTAYTISRVVRWADFSFDDGIETYEVITIGAVVLTVAGTLLLVAPTAMAVGGTASPGDSPAAWSESLEWMQGNTPQEGAYGTGENGSMEYYGTYPVQDDYDYGPGEYGVMSWWDYGHIITVQGERVPVANPFQQGSDVAANFLLAPNESQANAVLDGIDEDDAETRYVAVDWQMASTYGQVSRGKFFAPTRFYDTSNVSQGDYYGRIYNPNNLRQYFNLRTQNYYESMVTRLYMFHGSAVDAQPFVIDWEQQTTDRGQPYRAASANSTVLQFNTIEEARAYVEQDGTAQVGGVGAFPNEDVPALEHYRYVGSSNTSAYESSNYNRGTLTEATFLEPVRWGPPANNASNCEGNTTSMPIGGQAYCMPDGQARALSGTYPAWTQIYERVPGGTIEGTAPANTTIEGRIQMENDITGESFVYRQEAETGPNGTFEMTVPYSSTGYDEWGVDAGYTNVSVRATAPYTFRNESSGIPLNGTVEVTEGQVIGENSTASTVNLTEFDLTTEPDVTVDNGTANDTSTNETTTNGGSTTGSSTNETATTETATPSESLARPTVGVRP
jgi:dolichyl-diphosphooligosaccharide--protein glycosyltransferase